MSSTQAAICNWQTTNTNGLTPKKYMAHVKAKMGISAQ